MALLLTPLGIVAGGAAWGEWAAKDFSDAATRARIAVASGSVVPPAAAPSGLARMSALWTAPMPDYAPHFVKSAGFGYLLSAVFGVGLILSAAWIVQCLGRVEGWSVLLSHLNRNKRGEGGAPASYPLPHSPKHGGCGPPEIEP